MIIPGKHIRDMADGLRYARYTVQDYVGTPELQSQIVLLDAKPTPLPVNFSTPYLKETGSTGSSSTLDPVRASNGATVIIKAGTRETGGLTKPLPWLLKETGFDKEPRPHSPRRLCTVRLCEGRLAVAL